MEDDLDDRFNVKQAEALRWIMRRGTIDRFDVDVIVRVMLVVNR